MSRKKSSRLTQAKHLQALLAAIPRNFSGHWSEEPCIIWPFSFSKDGYGKVRLPGRSMRAPRAAYLLFYGNEPNHLACHHCDNRKCINPLHIFDGSAAENTRDAISKGRWAQGAKNGSAKRAQTDPGRVFDLHRSGETATAIAKWLGISQPYVSRILNGKRMNHA